MRVKFLGVVVISACTVGIAPSGGPPGGGTAPDAPTIPEVDAPREAPPEAGAGSNGCKNQVTSSIGDGHHNPGQNCMSACHNHGFTLAGTVYTSVTSNAAVTGASVSVTDANNQTFDMVTQANGNFWSSQAVAFPITVKASSCPAIASMTGPVAQGNGGCNMTGCHASGAQGHIHLP
jgi:hypothetical protein